MPFDVTEDARGALTVERRLHPFPRFVAGGICAAFALAILRFIVMAFVPDLRKEVFGRGEETGHELLGLTVGFLLCAVPAWMLFFRRAVVVLDRQAGTVRDYTSYVLWRFDRFHPMDHVGAVRLSTTGSKGGPNFAVELVLEDGTLVTVAWEDAEPPSRALARQVAERLRVPLDDRL